MASQSILLEEFKIPIYAISSAGYHMWLVEDHRRVYMGDVLCDVDGFYKFWPDVDSGYWSEHILQLILDKLREMNAAWEKDINDYFENAERKSQGESPSEDDTGLDPLSPFPPNNR